MRFLKNRLELVVLLVAMLAGLSITLIDQVTSESGRSATAAVGGSGPNDVWAVGESGTCLHWTGSSWAKVNAGTTQRLAAVWVSTAGEVWAGGATGVLSGTLVHAPSGGTFSPVGGLPAVNYSAMWGSAANDIWMVGAGGTIVHYDGSNWSTSPSPTANDLSDVSGTSASNVWIAGANGTVLHLVLGSWQVVTSNTSTHLEAIFATGSDVWASGNGTTLHGQGGPLVPVPGPDYYVRDMWGTSPSDIWAVETWGVMHHYNGSIWQRVTSGASSWYNGIWGASATDVWAVGDDGVIQHYAP